MSWRQADCHINNLYNTAFWALILNKSDDPSYSLKSNIEAESILKVLDAGGKNELLFSKYGINYNNIDPIFRKGTTLTRESIVFTKISSRTDESVERRRKVINEYHLDIIGDEFWNLKVDLKAILEKN